VAGGWRKPHKHELHNYVSPNIRATKSRSMKLTGHVTRKVNMRNAHNILVGKSEWKRPFGRYRRRWKDKIIIDLREIGC